METLATMTVPAMLAHFPSDALVGHLVVPENVPFQRQTYEVAAWFRDYRLDAGTYEVFVYRDTMHSAARDFLYAEVPGTVVRACLISLFGGVGYGPDTAGERAIGERGTYRLRAWLGYASEAATRRIDFGFGCTFIPLEE